MRALLFLFCIVFLSSCDAPQEERSLEPQLRLTAVDFSDLPGWSKDQLTQVIPAFEKSCMRIMKAPADKAMGALKQAGTYGDWQPICQEFLAIRQANNIILHDFFMQNFIPFSVHDGAEDQGLFTGYYEAALHGSRTRTDIYRYPLHTRPDDLVMVQLGDFREELKGQRIAGRVTHGRLRPYETRKDIVAGHWPHQEQVLVWVDNPIDAFFVQIQGSGLVTLADGSSMRIGYAGQNGHVYYAIGRTLIQRGALTKDNVSMQSIRLWLNNHPNEAADIMNLNESYVFFHELNGDGPLGGEGIALTSERSLAIDQSLMAYGLPFWIDINAPPDYNAERLQRLMIAQDTGGAIRGAIRGDFFWGYGEQAESLAGQMKSKGRYWILLPKDLIK